MAKIGFICLLRRIEFFFDRVEFDAYRMDFENTKVQDIARSTRSDTEEAHKTFLQHKELYEKLKADVAIKMQFLSENRVGFVLYSIYK